MPTAALVAGMAGAGVSAFGQVMQGIQSQKSAGAAATQQEQQGQVEQTAANAQIIGNDTEARKALGGVTTAAAASGVSTTSGSVNAVRSFDINQAILKDTYARYQGNMAEQNAYYAAKATRYQGKQAFNQGLLGAGSTLLTAGLNASAAAKAGSS
jgi:hypothetical protein